MTNSPTQNMTRIRLTIMAFSLLGLVVASLKSANTRFAIALQNRARWSITEPDNAILAHSFQQLMERSRGDVLIAALALALSVRLVLLIYPRLLRGLEFDYLKTIKEISRNQEITAFVEEAQSSLESQGSFEDVDCYERSLLHYAAMGNCLDLLLFLLESNPNIESRDHWGRTPLSWAAEYGSLTVIKVLLKRGANVNALDYEGIAPLNWLVEAGDPIIETLSATEAVLRDWGAKMSDYGASRGHESGF